MKELEKDKHSEQLDKNRQTSERDDAKQKSVAQKIVNVVALIIFAVVVITLLYVFISLIAGHQPSIFGYQLYYVVTDSMTGTIDKGQVIICKQYKDSTLHSGDIVTFIAPSGFEPSAIVGQKITHRLISEPYQDDNGVWVVDTKGDANSIPDKVPVPVENIRATYVRSSGFITGLMKFLRKWYGFVTLIIIPLVCALVFEVVKIIKYKTQEKERQVQASLQADIDKAVSQALEQAEKSKEQQLEESEEEQKKRIIAEYLANQENKGDKQ